MMLVTVTRSPPSWAAMLPQTFSAATTLGRPSDPALPTPEQLARGTTSAQIAMAIACRTADDMPPRPFRDRSAKEPGDDNGSGSHRQTYRLPGGRLSAHWVDGGHPPGGARYNVTPPMVIPYVPRRANRSSHARGAGARRITVATSCCCRYRRNREIGGVATSYESPTVAIPGPRSDNPSLWASPT